MRRTLRLINGFFKNIILWLRPGIVFGFLSGPLLFFSNLFSMTRWIARQQQRKFYNDFFVFPRNLEHRYNLYAHVVESQGMANEAIDYLEFGVSQGYSFRWWANQVKHANARFYGFDTFEGLPEAWGTFRKGDMAAGLPQMDDPRCSFFKGLFQDTLYGFIAEHPLQTRRKVIHLDADIFSATLFVLTNLARELRPGDILIFDEFNVPNHEWMAYRIVSDSFYLKTELIGAINNYTHTAFKVL